MIVVGCNDTAVEVYDRVFLEGADDVLDKCANYRARGQEVLNAVKRDEE